MTDKRDGVYSWGYLPHETEENLSRRGIGSVLFDYADEQGELHSLQMIQYSDCFVEEYYANNDFGELYFDFELGTAQRILLATSPTLSQKNKFFLLESGSVLLVFAALVVIIFSSISISNGLGLRATKHKSFDERQLGIVLVSCIGGFAASLPVWLLSEYLSRKAENLLKEGIHAK